MILHGLHEYNAGDFLCSLGLSYIHNNVRIHWENKKCILNDDIDIHDIIQHIIQTIPKYLNSGIFSEKSLIGFDRIERLKYLHKYNTENIPLCNSFMSEYIVTKLYFPNGRGKFFDILIKLLNNITDKDIYNNICNIQSTGKLLSARYNGINNTHVNMDEDVLENHMEKNIGKEILYILGLHAFPVLCNYIPAIQEGKIIWPIWGRPLTFKTICSILYLMTDIDKDLLRSLHVRKIYNSEILHTRYGYDSFAYPSMEYIGN